VWFRHGDRAELRPTIPERGASGVALSGPLVAGGAVADPRPNAGRLLAHARPDPGHGGGSRRGVLTAPLR
jgi:hypothetical protein